MYKYIAMTGLVGIIGWMYCRTHLNKKYDRKNKKVRYNLNSSKLSTICTYYEFDKFKDYMNYNKYILDDEFVRLGLEVSRESNIDRNDKVLWFWNYCKELYINTCSDQLKQEMTRCMKQCFPKKNITQFIKKRPTKRSNCEAKYSARIIHWSIC